MEFTFSPEQIQLSNQYMEQRHRYTMVSAQMQSGKTGAYYLTAFRMLHEGWVRQAIVLCGSSELDLREQCEMDKHACIARFRCYLEDVHQHMQRQEREALLKQLANSIQIVFRQNIPAFLKKHGKHPLTDTLIVWEESHYAQSHNQSPDSFFQAFHIPVNGDCNVLEMQNNYVLSISATGFSEFINLRRKSQDKRLLYLRQGDEYVGVQWYRDNRRLIPVNTKTPRSILRTLEEALAYMVDARQYALVRCSDVQENLGEMRGIARQFGMDVVEYFGDGIFYYGDLSQCPIQTLDDLKNEPIVPTLILLKGRCRMGKVIPKPYIRFVMETSKQMATDTALQSLLGRMCGYHTNTSVRIYLPANLLKKKDDGMSEIDKAVAFMTGKDVTPTGMNVQKVSPDAAPRLYEGDMYYPIIPIKIHEQAFEPFRHMLPDMGSLRKEDKAVIRKHFVPVIKTLISGAHPFVENKNQGQQRIEFMTRLRMSSFSIRYVDRYAYSDNKPAERAEQAFLQNEGNRYFTNCEKVYVLWIGHPAPEGMVPNTIYIQGYTLQSVENKKDTCYLPLTTGKEVTA
jgi:hypothetical protein